MRTACCILLAGAVSYCSAQSRNDWRFWTAADGLKESYSRRMSIGADGRLWVRHGAVDGLSVLDGYSIALVPEVRQAKSFEWAQVARVYGGHAGEAWAVEAEALQRWDGKRWNVEARQQQAEKMIE